MTSRFRKLSEERVYHGAIIDLAHARYAAPDGQEFERDIVRSYGAVAVVPVDDDGKVTLVRQFRAAIEQDLLEIPAGKQDVSDEEPVETAKRELAEEVGLRADSYELLCRFYNSAGFCDELTWVYLATGLAPADLDRQGIEEAHMAIETFSLDDVLGLIARGEIIDAKTTVGLSLVLARRA